MRIAQISTASTSVRRHGSDSIESLVWLLSRELSALGHEVTVFAAAGSEVPGELVETLPGAYGEAGAPADWRLCEWISLGQAIAEAERFDVLHSHAYLWGLPLDAVSRAPMVHTLHVTPYDDERRLRRLYPHACVTGISRFQWSAFPECPPAAVIHHGVDPAEFPFNAAPEDYVCFLGRFIPGKGPLEAIELARELGIPLRLAGRRNEFFERKIAPLVDGRSVAYVGHVQGAAKAELLGGARALLYPVQAPEPFGLVLVESMLCGTPVLGRAIGAVPEIVESGVTGAVASTVEELTRAAQHVFDLDRETVRQTAAARFSPRRMAEQYEAVYRGIGDRRRRAAGKGEP